MNAFEELNKLIAQTYTDDDGNAYEAELMPGMLETEVELFANTLPGKKIPQEIEDLLLYSTGFSFYGLGEVSFVGLDEDVGDLFSDVLANYISLASDGFGNYWCLFIKEDGTWEGVYYISHDPFVIVKHSENLAEFIHHVAEFGRNEQESHLDFIHDTRVFEVAENDEGLMSKEAVARKDAVLKEFANDFGSNFLFGDLRNKKISTGVSFENAISISRHDSELIWALEQRQENILERARGKVMDFRQKVADKLFNK